MKLLYKFLTIISLTFGFQLNAEDAPQTEAMNEAQAIEVLMKIETFGFGPAKGQRERASDTAFQALITNSNAKEKFTTLFDKGRTFSKLYALCALHSIDPPAFEKLSKSMNAEEKIHSRFGCVIEELKVSEIIKNIANGDYERYSKTPDKA